MSSTSRSRRFIKHPAGSKLWIVVTIDPPGSVGVKPTFSVDGTERPTSQSPPVMSFNCPQPGTAYRVEIDIGWQATGKVVIACWLERPDHSEIHRDSMVFSGKNGNVDAALIQVVTS